MSSQFSILSGLYRGNQTGAVCGQGASPGVQLSSRSLVQEGGYGSSPAAFQDDWLKPGPVSFWEEAELWAEAWRILRGLTAPRLENDVKQLVMLERISRTLLCKLIMQLLQSLFGLIVYYLTELQVLEELVLHSTVKIRWSEEKRGLLSPLHLKD